MFTIILLMTNKLLASTTAQADIFERESVAAITMATIYITQ